MTLRVRPVSASRNCAYWLKNNRGYALERLSGRMCVAIVGVFP